MLLGVYNLLPGLPLDGGALVKCPVWKASGSEALGTSIAAWAGLAIAVCVFAVPFVLAARLGLDGPDASSVVLVALFAGWLAMGALDALRRARAERRIPGIGAGRLARTPLLVAADLPLSSALEMRAQAGAARLVVADPSGRPIAVGDEAAIAAVPEHRRPWVSVGSVSRTLAADAVVTESLEGSELLSRLGEGSASDYLVVDDGGQLTGVLSVADVHAALTAP